MKFRIRLEDKTTKKQVTIHVPLYNEMNGLMQFPVDLNVFTVLTIDRYSGKENIYENDVIDYVVDSGGFGFQRFVAVVTWDAKMLAFTCKTALNYTHNMLAHAQKLKVLGNLRDEPDLIKQIGETKK
jgi:hypothetical protein